MSTFNPLPLNPSDARAKKSNGKNVPVNSLAYEQNLAQYAVDVMLMQQQYAYDDQWWNEHDSPEATTAQLRALGYSDAFIANVLGGGSNSQQGDAPFVSAVGDNPAESAAAVGNQITGVANSITNQVNADTQARVGDAQVENLKAQATKNLTDAGLAPGLVSSTIRKNDSGAALDYSNVARNNVLNDFTAEETRLVSKKIDLTEEQITNYQLQNYWYNDVTAAELRESQARTTEYFSRAKLNLANVEVANSQVDLNEMLTNESQERIYNIAENTANLRQDTINKEQQFKQMSYEFNYMISHDGVKLDMDTQQKVDALILAGKIDEAEKLCMGQYKLQLYRKSGETFGEFVLPSDGYDSGVRMNTFGVLRDAAKTVIQSPMMFNMGRQGFSPSSPSVSNGGKLLPQSSPNPSGGFKPIPNKHYKVDGKDWRMDSHGTVWINGVPQ